MKHISNKIFNYKNNKQVFLNYFSKHKKIVLLCIILISYVLLYFLLDFSSQSLVAHDEGLYARRARLVEESFNWFSSPFEGPHHKTLGSYWLIALSIRLFGSSELALRLPSIIASFLCLFITYFITSKIANKHSAFISVVSLSSMPLWIQYSRYASPDILFVLCILLVILFFLKFIDTNQYNKKHFYIFLSGLFISTTFFIRSYMLFVPILGLSPFLSFHLLRSKNVFKITFSLGLLIGLIPTILNLYFSYRQYGIKGVTLLFDFAKDKSIGSFDFYNLLLIPINYLYLTFPIGILLIIVLSLTKSNNKINYPLLIYIYPFISLIILLSMSNSHIHYYLFLFPSLSMLFSIKFQSLSFRFSYSKKIISNLLFFLMVLISVALLSSISYYKDLIIDYSYGNIFLLYLVSLLLVISFLLSLRYLFDTKYTQFNLIKFFYNIIFPQYILISLLYNFGIVGNPNSKLKYFLKDDQVSNIISSNTIYLYNVDSKMNTLLRYYLPSAKVLKSSENIFMYDYIITSNKKVLNKYHKEFLFNPIASFDNHFLLRNIPK